jgi:hypothetical protein
VISLELARALRDAGVPWHPASGDRFVISQPEMQDEVFTLSEMTIEAHTYPTGTVLGFNGTTEWALDSVDKDATVWLPREDQMRDMLGGTFRSLARDEDGTWVVTARPPGGHDETYVAADPADAYARALLALVARAVRG